MPKFNITICPVCGNSSFTQYLTCSDHLISGEQFDIKQCDGCGLKFTSNTESEEDSDKYYKSDNYISHSNSSKGLINKLYHPVRRYMLKRKRGLIEKLSGREPGTLLDIGAGTGFFLDEMKRHGWRTYGTEKSETARNFAKERFNIHIDSPSELKNFVDKQFNIVTLWHVLEHIYNLYEYMDNLVRIMKDDGFVVIAVPNSNSFDALFYKEFWAAYDVPRHIWHFSPEQVKLLGEKHGLSLKHIRKMPFDAFYISILSEKYKGNKLPFLKGFITGKISWILTLFDYRKCSSLIYIFKKE